MPSNFVASPMIMEATPPPSGTATGTQNTIFGPINYLQTAGPTHSSLCLSDIMNRPLPIGIQTHPSPNFTRKILYITHEISMFYLNIPHSP